MYKELGTQIGTMVDEKQVAYGDSFGIEGVVLRVRLRKYRREVPGRVYYEIPEALLDELLAIVRIDDKLMRICSNPENDKMNESPWQDIAGYGLLKSGEVV